MAENNRAVVKLKEHFADALLDYQEFRGEVTVTVKKEKILEVLKCLRGDLRYNFLTDVTAVDYLGQEPRFQVVYHLMSIQNKDRIRVKAPVTEADCSIDSATALWNSANWVERETYDLMGIKFKNHPNLVRILMTDDWEGHPLRKDYPVQGPDREPYQGRLS
jgi:NADH-quinone oxidoreductase subunit C